jgi:hypothetical protein
MKTNYILFLSSIIAYALIGYVVPRTSFEPFAVLYLLLFGLYFYWCYQAKTFFKDSKWKVFLAGSILLRAVFLVALPELSDDFWRYLWDGRLLSVGVNPYEYAPLELLDTVVYKEAHLDQLYTYLNSPKFYSVYPPVTQLFFAISTFFFIDNVLASVVVFHLLVLCLELGTIIFLVKLLQHLKQPVYLAFFYAFNPLVILELSGNLHTESILIFFLTLALYMLVKQSYRKSALAFSMAVGAKLLPLMFMPLILHRLWFKKGLQYCVLVGLVNIGLFALFFDLEMIQKMQTSMGLYFGHFEFNGSIYYLMRYWVINEYWRLWDYHEHFMDVHLIENLLKYDWYVFLRKALPIIDLLLIIYLSLKRQVRKSEKAFLASFLAIYSVHFFLATTVHPWYVTTLVLFAILSPYRIYVLLWTALIGFTYISYQGGSFEESSWVIGLEYWLVFGVLIWELWQQRKNEKSSSVALNNPIEDYLEDQ